MKSVSSFVLQILPIFKRLNGDVFEEVSYTHQDGFYLIINTVKKIVGT